MNQELFKPLYNSKKTEKGIYTKLPVQLHADGSYHAFGKFISGVAAMPRIVTQHDIKITTNNSAKKEKYPLSIEMRAQIYNYVDDSEEDK